MRKVQNQSSPSCESPLGLIVNPIIRDSDKNAISTGNSRELVIASFTVVVRSINSFSEKDKSNTIIGIAIGITLLICNTYPPKKF